MRNGENKTEITPPGSRIGLFFVLGAPEEGVNCQVFFEITHVRGVGRWLLVL